ncbi:MAG TPA: PEP-CTERM sorting domain-containing protein [Roseiarcus sp.]|nr:PEP-CTERM sorting domain-containing protein [Roseiarcus sp.]
MITPVDLIAMNVIGYNLAAVPEPSTWALLASGFLGLGGLARRRKRCASGGVAAFGVGSGGETARQT